MDILDEGEAKAAALKRAAAEGWDLKAYDAPTARLEGGSWTVLFSGRQAAPGNHFLVVVDDATGETELWPGR